MSDILNSNHRLLVIDDNPAIHQDFRKILAGNDDLSPQMQEVEAELFGTSAPKAPPTMQFEVASALTGNDGLAEVENALANGKPFAVAFIDVRMPVGWDGIETASRICEKDGDIQIVLCTAFSDYSWSEMIQKIGQSERLLILKKPFDGVEVMQLAHALTEKWALRQAARSRLEELEQIVGRRTLELKTANEQLKTEMAERARAEDALRQAQKMEALGQLAGGVAHDFNNLLTVIRGYAQCLIVDGQQSVMALEALSQIDAAAERAANLTSQMLLFSRKKRLRPEFLNVNEIVPQLGKMLRRLIGEDIAMEFECSSTVLTIHADRAMVEQIVMNLVVNSRDAMPGGGRIKISAEEAIITDEMARCCPKARAGKFACITVTDSGHGIAPESLPHLFEPFFTTKEPGKGTGLGLATVYGVVKQHDGWIDVKSEPGRGATFKIYLPIAVESAIAAAARNENNKSAGGSETILLVEDEDAVRSLASRILARHGYQVIEARSGVEALSIWEREGSRIDLLLTDMVMPDGVSGWTLAQKLQSQKPGLKTVYTTGYSLDAIAHDHTLKEGLNFLPKPYDPQGLVDTVRRCLDSGIGRWIRPGG
ncbi:MAG TPA: response regulator [Candidatus Paceibacterota bacterium]|nr:response regulator [Candidatus Paceibacterota bacterium]